MTTLTIELDDDLINALRDAAERRHTTVDEIVGSAVSETLDRARAPKTFRELASEAPLSFEPGRIWNREESHDRSLLR